MKNTDEIREAFFYRGGGGRGGFASSAGESFPSKPAAAFSNIVTRRDLVFLCMAGSFTTDGILSYCMRSTFYDRLGFKGGAGGGMGWNRKEWD